MLPAKFAYFFMFSSIGALMPFVNIFLVSAGLTVRETGVISAIVSVAAMIIPPVVGMLADSTRHKKLLTFVLTLAVAGLYFSPPWIAGLLVKKKTAEEFHSALCGLMAVILFLAKGARISLISVLDSIVTDMIKTISSKETFGNQRMFAAFGMAISTLLAGVAVDASKSSRSTDTSHDYVAAFWIALPCTLLVIPFTITMLKHTSWTESNDSGIQEDDECPPSIHEIGDTEPSDQEIEADNTKGIEKKSKKHQLCDVLREPGTILMLVSVLLFGILWSTFFGYLFLFMREQMGSSKTAMGVSELVGGLSQTLFYPLTAPTIKRLGGPIISMLVAVFGWSCTLLFTSFIRNPWLVILPQFIQGASGALSRASMAQFTSDVSPKDVYITMFSLMTAVYQGVGGVIGGAVFGVVYQEFGGSTTYICVSAIGFCWVAVMGFLLFAPFKKCGGFHRYEQIE